MDLTQLTIKLNSYITNDLWLALANKLVTYNSLIIEDHNYIDLIGVNYAFNPATDHVMSTNSSLFVPKKALAIEQWYINGDRNDHSITEVFEEYKRCVDDEHKTFNSNYGYYAFKLGLLDKCVDRILENTCTRQAMFCINNNDAMSDLSIDKLCTNTIQFFLCSTGSKELSLNMVVQMRSSNFISLLPYDAFMFSFFYAYVFNKLFTKSRVLRTYLTTGKIMMQVASLHMYLDEVNVIEKTKKIPCNLLGDFRDKNWLNIFEHKLIKLVENYEVQ